MFQEKKSMLQHGQANPQHIKNPEYRGKFRGSVQNFLFPRERRGGHHEKTNSSSGKLLILVPT